MSIVKTLIGTNYRILRAPAGLFHDKVMKRLPDDSLLRLSSDGTLGLLDAIVGRITDDDELRERGGAIAKDVSTTLQNRMQKQLPFNPAMALTPPPSRKLPTSATDGANGLDIDPAAGP